jgi:serine protease AprX
MMLPRFLFLSVAILISSLLSQARPVMLWVEFTDKENSSHSLSRPAEFLSQRAIERRQSQMIPLDEYDLPVSSSYIEQITSLSGVGLYYTSRWFNGALLAIDNELDTEFIEDLPFVKRIENVKPEPEPEPEKKKKNEDSFGNLERMQDTVKINYSETFGPLMSTSTAYWNTYPEYGLARGQLELVNGQALHKLGYWGHEKIIAVLDSGFSNVDTVEAFNHLWFDNKILGSRDFVNPGGSVFRSHSHGTHVLSVMGALMDGNYAGVSLGASYWLLRTEDASTEFRIEEYNWLAGAEFADSVGADIINSSLGYTRFDVESQNYTYQDLDGKTTVVARAANIAFSRGMLVVTSAGNYGTQSWRYLGSPADALGALAIGGTDDAGNRVLFSSVGPSADGRIKPDVMAQGRAVATVNPSGGTSNANGTSFSSPLIAGLAACLWQGFPKATNTQIKYAIIQSADRFLSPDSLYGNGIPDFQKAYDILKISLKEVEPLVSLALNPIVPDSALMFHADREENITLELFSSNGQRIFYISGLPVVKGHNEIKPFRKIEQLNSGVYFIRMNFQDRSELIKAIKL